MVRNLFKPFLYFLSAYEKSHGVLVQEENTRLTHTPFKNLGLLQYVINSSKLSNLVG